MFNVPEMALAGAAGLGAYELYHHHQYGNFGFGNPYNNGMGYGSPYGYNNMGFGGFGGPHHGHHHHHFL
jgi:hypothetical protein